MNELTQLYQRLASGSATEQEKDRLVELMTNPENEADARKLLADYFQLVEHRTVLAAISEDRLKMIADSIQLADAGLPQLPSSAEATRRSALSGMRWWKYAAAIVLLITGIAMYFNFSRIRQPEEKNKPAISLSVARDLPPGTNRATLTLSSGETVELNNATTEIITDGRLSIENAAGRLNYTSADVAAMNTVSTPKGGQYQVILADGTAVWLNAASSITYPTAFKGSVREVSITGEAYFEVAKNAEKPFIVKNGHEQITVLGTTFNVNGYADEPASKTSLLEGSVKINDKILRPGQSYINGNVANTDVKQDVAWRNGVFNFDGANLKMVMRQLSRWYDLDIEYAPGVPSIEFGGELQRNLNLSQILKILESSKVNFQLEGRKLLVKP